MFKNYNFEKIERQTLELEALRYRDQIPITEFLATPEDLSAVYPAFTKPNSKSKKMKIGDFWSGRDTYLWLHCDFKVPGEWKKENFLGLFDFGTTGHGYNSGFESLVFINGVPYQGVDTNHQEVFFESAIVGNAVSLDFRLWSGLEGGGKKQIQYHQLNRACLCRLDTPADNLYYLLKNMLEAIKILPEDNPSRYQIENVVNQGYKLLNFTNPGSPEFYASVGAALGFYEKALKAIPKFKNVSVSCIGHTHIDLAWKWRYKHSREKAERSFSTVLRLMEKYPEYIFLQTQAQIYDAVKQDHPELFEAIRKRVAEGRWEPSGGMWVEADCNIPSGESLVRQILYGKNFFKKEFGFDSTFLWLPDTFGFNWALPQILKKSGIDTFLTSKLSLNESELIPHDTFIWSGLDGSQVLAHFFTTPNPESQEYYVTYNGQISPKTVWGSWTNYRDKALNRSLVIPYGFGDGGGGTTRVMLENLRAIAQMPGMPQIKTEKVTGFLKRLHTQVEKPENNALLHVWDKELYLQRARGSYTSQAQTKRMNRKLELLYRDAEILQSLMALKTKKWNEGDKDKLHNGWKFILLNQFHDILPGSSITEVYEDTRKEHGIAWNLGFEVYSDALASICGKDETKYGVINTAGWPRAGMVKLPRVKKNTALFCGTQPLVIQDSDYEGAPATYVWTPQIAPLGSVTLQAGKSAGEVSGKKNFSLKKNGIVTPFYAIKWNDQGQIVSLIDRKVKREALCGPGNQLQIFEDRPHNLDAWQIEATIDQKREIISALKSCTVMETGPLFARIRFIWTYGKSKITQDMILYSMHKRIDFKTEVDWQERSKLLKAAFFVDIRATSARYDIQYGSMERSSHKSTGWDEAQFEAPAHQWTDFSEKGFGVSLMNESKYGYDIKGKTMRISLLRAPDFPDIEADRGVQQFTYSIYTHGDPWYASDLIPLAWDLNAPLIAVSGECTMGDLVNLSAPGMALDTVKQSEDGTDLIFRFHELHGGRTKLKLSFNQPVSGYVETDLMEQPLGRYKKNQVITRELQPFEIVTFRVVL